MHVVQIIESFSSGTLYVAREIVRESVAKGWKTTVFYGKREGNIEVYKNTFPTGVEFVLCVQASKSMVYLICMTFAYRGLLYHL